VSFATTFPLHSFPAYIVNSLYTSYCRCLRVSVPLSPPSVLHFHQRIHFEVTFLPLISPPACQIEATPLFSRLSLPMPLGTVPSPQRVSHDVCSLMDYVRSELFPLLLFRCEEFSPPSSAFIQFAPMSRFVFVFIPLSFLSMHGLV